VNFEYPGSVMYKMIPLFLSNVFICTAVSASGANVVRTFHGTVREDAHPGDEVTLDDGQLRAYDTPSSEGCFFCCHIIT